MVMSIMSQWFGMGSATATPSAEDTWTSESTPSGETLTGMGRPRPLRIEPAGTDTLRASESSSDCSSSDSSPRKKARTKSDELLGDFDAMRFLAEVDTRLNMYRSAPTEDDLQRLEAFYAQAQMDGCEPLLDIVEHFEEVAQTLKSGSGSSDVPPLKCF